MLLAVICFERTIGEIYKGFFKHRHQEYNEVFTHYNLLGLKKQSAKISIGIFFTLILVLLYYFFAIIPSFIFQLNTNRYLTGAILGLIGGITVAIGGALKDTTFEHFSLIKFFRSPFAGLIGGILLTQVATTDTFIIFASIGFERVVCECYKTFIRLRTRGIFENQSVKHKGWLRLRWFFVHTYAFGVYILLVNLFLGV